MFSPVGKWKGEKANCESGDLFSSPSPSSSSLVLCLEERTGGRREPKVVPSFFFLSVSPPVLLLASFLSSLTTHVILAYGRRIARWGYLSSGLRRAMLRSCSSHHPPHLFFSFPLTLFLTETSLFPLFFFFVLFSWPQACLPVFFQTFQFALSLLFISWLSYILGKLL